MRITPGVRHPRKDARINAGAISDREFQNKMKWQQNGNGILTVGNDPNASRYGRRVVGMNNWTVSEN